MNNTTITTMMIPSKDTVILSLERADSTARRPVFQRARPTENDHLMPAVSFDA
jgi:hypothetical protein